MSTRRTLCLAFLFGCGSLAAPAEARVPDPAALRKLTATLQAGLDAAIAERVVPGATLAVRFAGGHTISLAAGLADVEKGVPMPRDAVMFSGSVGKTCVAAIVLKLCERGRLSLRARAGDLLRDPPWLAQVPNGPAATVETLLNHTAGIPEYAGKPGVWQRIRQNPDQVWSVAERLAHVFGDPPTGAPGRSWAYADSHYLLLGLIVEQVTGKPYDQMLEETILKPCRLYRTRPADRRSLPGLVPGYTELTREFLLPRKVVENGRYVFNPQLEWTGGGLVTTVSDLASWASQLYGGEVLRPESKRRMLAPVPFRTLLFEDAGYGLGCMIGQTDGVTHYGHTGFAPGYVTLVQYLPDAQIAIAMQFNTDASHGNDRMKVLFNALKRKILAAGAGAS